MEAPTTDRRHTAEEATEDGPFRFLDLAAELQLRIIEYAVLEDTPIIIPISENELDDAAMAESKLPEIEQRRTQPAIARVCRGIRFDALKAYYNLNSFRAGTEVGCCCFWNLPRKGLVDWLKAIGPTNRGHILDLRIYNESYKGHDASQLWSMDGYNIDGVDPLPIYIRKHLGSYGVELSEPFYDQELWPERKVKFPKKL